MGDKENLLDERTLQIDVHNISYSLIVNKQLKVILRDITFSIESGKMVGLMGPSGSGKSTLMDLLANRTRIGYWSGDIFYKDSSPSDYFSKNICYVQQEDLHISTLTVRETIYYSAWTRLSEGTSQQHINKRVNELIDLKSVEDCFVGDIKNRIISGGQMKRLSIAVGMISLPNIIFLDEPCSALDSQTGLQLSDLNNKRTSITVIHQPSPEIFLLFDKILLLSQGRLIYCGPPKDSMIYFSQSSFGFHYNPEINSPAEFLIEIASENSFIIKSVSELERIFRQSPYYSINYNGNNSIQYNNRNVDYNYNNKSNIIYASSWITQLKMLLSRSWKARIRERGTIIVVIISKFILALLLGTMYFNQLSSISFPLYNDGVPNPSISNISAILFYAIFTGVYFVDYETVSVCENNKLYRRESDSFTYSSFPYWLVTIISDLPFLFLYASVFYNVFYIFVGGWSLSFKYYLYCYFLFYLVVIVTKFQLNLIVSIVNDAPTTYHITSNLNSFFLALAGFVNPINSVIIYYQWATIVSFPRWAFDGLMTNEWSQYETDDNVIYNNNGNVLNQYGFAGFNKFNSFWILSLYALIFTLLYYYFIRPIKKKLVKVSDAETIIDIIALPHHKLRSFWFLATNNPLKERLLSREERHQVPIEDDNNNEKMVTNKTLYVDMFRVNTGDIDFSKGFQIIIRNLNFSVINKSNRNTKAIPILTDISANIQSGELVAIMGVSGSGKTTLLDLMYGKKRGGEMTGDILFNGEYRDETMDKRLVYIKQTDVLISTLTFRQTIYYAALLLLKESLPKAYKEERVSKIIRMLCLDEVADNIVGDIECRGISGGQRKRLSLAVGIVGFRDTILCDEPTSGLDSTSSYETVAALRNLSNKFCTVVFSIHNPSEKIYSLFDKTLLLAEGKVLYFGKSKDAKIYFMNSIYCFQFVEGSNPADFLIIIASGSAVSQDGLQITAEDLSSLYSNSNERNELIDNIKTDILVPKTESIHIVINGNNNDDNSNYNTSTWNQLKILTHRRIIIRLKATQDRLTLIFYVVWALFYGSLMLQLPTGSGIDAYNNRLSVLYYSLQFSILNELPMIQITIEDRLLLYQERSSKMYGIIPYWIVNWILDIPLMIFNTFVYSVIVYFMVGLRAGIEYFFFFWLILFETSFTAMLFIKLMAYTLPTIIIASAINDICLFIIIGFAGYIIYVPKFPLWLSWGPSVSFVRYSFQGLVLNEFDGNDDLPLQADYIDNLGFSDLNKYSCVVIVFAFIISFMFLQYFALKFISYDQ